MGESDIDPDTVYAAEPEQAVEPEPEPEAKPKRKRTRKSKTKNPEPLDPAALAKKALEAGNKELRKHSNYAKFLPADQLSEKQLHNAVKYVAKGEKVEDVLGMYDESLFDSGKSGIVLTRTTLYSGWAKKNPVNLRTLKQVHVGDRSCHLVMLFEDGHCEDVFFNNDYLAVKAILDVYIEAYQQ